MTSHNPVIGFIGFGEAGFHIANGLRSAGIERIYAFDIQTPSSDVGPLIRQRAERGRTQLANYMIGRVVLHGERRAREMEEVAETLRALGVDPIMAEATVRRQDWSAQMGLGSHFGTEGPADYHQVVEVIHKVLNA